MRWLLGLVIVSIVVAAVVLWRRPPPSAKVESVEPAPSLESGPAPNAGDAQREAARLSLLRMSQALARLPARRHAVETSPARRPGEPEALFTERTRTLEQYHHFLHDMRLGAEREEALAAIILDAQEKWQQALAGAGRTQPEEPGAEMKDPLLQQLYVPINDDALQAAHNVMAGTRGEYTFQSYLPSMLPFMRTRVFEAARP